MLDESMPENSPRRFRRIVNARSVMRFESDGNKTRTHPLPQSDPAGCIQKTEKAESRFGIRRFLPFGGHPIKC